MYCMQVCTYANCLSVAQISIFHYLLHSTYLVSFPGSCAGLGTRLSTYQVENVHNIDMYV